jgi:Hemingway/CFA97
MLEEQRNTEIERSNRILLEKIQRIAKRSVPNIIKKRAITEDSYE